MDWTQVDAQNAENAEIDEALALAQGWKVDEQFGAKWTWISDANGKAMAAHPELVYCAGGNPQFAAIAVDAGYRYGCQFPHYTPYAPVWFADQNWKQPVLDEYRCAIQEHRPHSATVLDWEREEQFDAVMQWAEAVAPFVEDIIIIPKIVNSIGRLPVAIGAARVVLGFSVPTQFSGTPVPAFEFGDRPIHLLGGSPHEQMRLARYLHVVSVDGNMHNLMAHRYCAFWRQRKGNKGHWHQLQDIGQGDYGQDANREAFRRSCVNIMAAWKGESHDPC